MAAVGGTSTSATRLEELIPQYDQSGLLTMIVQEFINCEQFVRCMCLGQEEILVMHYDPKERRYMVEDDYLAPALRERVVHDCRTIVRALGYDMNSIEFAIRDGVPYAIDFMNPAPDMDINSLTQPYFDWVVQHMADMAIRLAKGGRRQVEQTGWAELFKSSRRTEGRYRVPSTGTLPATEAPGSRHSSSVLGTRYRTRYRP